MTYPLSARSTLLLLLLLSALSCSGQETRDANAQRALGAAALQPGQRPDAAHIQTLTVRFYVDPAYEAEVSNPHERLTQLVERASAILLPTFGVRLRVLDFKTWERQAPRDDLDAMLAELIALDPAQEAHWVVGVAPVNGAWTHTQHSLGLARLLSPHFVLRNTADHEEEALLKQQHSDATPSVLRDLLLERRAHKETVAFLHAWAHTLGALHTRQGRSLLAPLYSPQADAFQPANVALIRAALERLDPLRNNPIDEDTAAHLLRALNQQPAEAFQEESRVQLLDLLQQLITHAQPGLPADAVEPYNSALQRLRDGAPQDALALLDAPLARHTAQPLLLLLACEAQSRLPEPGDLERCDQAAKANPEDPTPHLHAASALHSLQRDDRAIDHAASALQRLQTWRHPDAPEHLKSLQRLFETLGALTLLEQLAPRLGPAAGQPILDRTLAVRQHLGVPPDLLKPALEAQAVRYLRASLQPKATPPPRPPGLPDTLPGLHLVDCAHLRAKNPKDAYKACLRAVERWDQTWLASFYLGSLDLQQKRYPQAEQHLKRVLRVHPAEPAAWRNLAIALQALKKTEERQELDQDYQRRFQRGPLP